MEFLSRDNPVFAGYAFYSALLAFKVLAVVVLRRHRFKELIFARPEDTELHPTANVRYSVQVMERVRWAQVNDWENIPMFWVVGLLYMHCFNH